MHRKDGFTLIELIVVIAILGILALFLVPSFIGYAKDAKAAICDSNLVSINRAYQSKLTKLGESENQALLLDVLNNKDNEYFSTTPECPSGGIYSTRAYTDSTGKSAYNVYCTEHSETESTIPVQIIDQISDLQNNPSKYEKYNDNKPLADWQLKSNDQIRKILKKANGDKWPELTIAGKNELLYVMPYADVRNTDTYKGSGDIFIYAKTSESGWNNVKYIYDIEEEAWYAAPTAKDSDIMIVDKSFATVKEEMKTKKWIKLDEKNYSISGEIILP